MAKSNDVYQDLMKKIALLIDAAEAEMNQQS